MVRCIVGDDALRLHGRGQADKQSERRGYPEECLQTFMNRHYGFLQNSSDFSFSALGRENISTASNAKEKGRPFEPAPLEKTV